MLHSRIINILYLMMNDLLDVPVLYLSSYIINNKSDYYRLLNEVRTKDSWEEWVLYMLNGIEITSRESIKLIESIIGILKSVKIGRDIYFVNTQLFNLLQNKGTLQ